MRIYIGSDHAGFELKAKVGAALRGLGHDVIDCGPEAYVSTDDYPPYCLTTATRTVADPGSLGIVIGGSGNGEAIAANKVKGARCVLAHSEETARLGREHNDANVISFGARTIAEADALRYAMLFVATTFRHDLRHQRRIDMLTKFEATGEIPPL